MSPMPVDRPPGIVRSIDHSTPAPVAAGLSLGLRNADVFEIQHKLQQGLPFAALNRFEKASELPKAAILDVIRLPARTLARRKASGKLSFEESERLFRLSRVFQRAVELYQGKVDVARRWFETPCHALGNQTPKDMTKTEVGAQEVLDLIGRLEHGVYS